MIGFIGAGNMGSAIIRRLLLSKIILPSEVMVCDRRIEPLTNLKNEFNIKVTQHSWEVVANCDIIFLCVKPQDMEALLLEIKEQSKNKLFVSIAAGISTAFIGERLDESARVIRVMPNTPALVGEMTAGYCLGTKATESDAKKVESLLSAAGRIYRVDEGLMDVVTGLSGSGPAYYYLIISALAEGGMEEGLDRETALKLSASTAIGAGKMILESREDPDTLIERVCSPGGTTIEGMKELEKGKIKEILKRAVKAATKRSRELGRS